MAYIIKVSSRFKKDFKRCIKRGLDMRLITQVMNTLAETGTLPSQYRPHKLSRNMEGIWECHIQSDWLMTWQQDNDQLTLLFLQTGTHSDIF